MDNRKDLRYMNKTELMQYASRLGLRVSKVGGGYLTVDVLRRNIEEAESRIGIPLVQLTVEC